MNNLQLIQNKIYEIRGQQVMLDYDLAEMYGVETAQLKRAVRRNIERFEGDDFMFELTKEELSRCQFGILKEGRGSNFKYMPFAFTELGVAMLSSVLRSATAIEITRGIMLLLDHKQNPVERFIFCRKVGAPVLRRPRTRMAMRGCGRRGTGVPTNRVGFIKTDKY